MSNAGEMEGKVKDADMEDDTSLMATDDVMLDDLMKGATVKVMTDADGMATRVEKKYPPLLRET